MAPHSRGRSLEAPEHPGAGTVFVYSPSPSGNQPWPPTWSDACFAQEGGAGPSGTKKTRDLSPDAMLDRGIAEYAFIPAAEGGVLGRGKFSTVYKVRSATGDLFALKHTPLHPHHPLIAARLLREPTLLAQLPPHPCLIGVEGWVRTPGHFYLVEQLASTHVPLPSQSLPLSPTRAAYILDQLVSVIRDCLHAGGRVCHRDLKGENVLVDPETGEILIIDLGLATHFSMSEAKLTTCCGSPAFHSPEIVNALNHPPGAVTYYGPELDIWCIALTLLSLLTSSRFPLGPAHSSLPQMAARVTERLDVLDKMYPPSAPWVGMKRILSSAEKAAEGEEWRRVRAAMSDFLQIDGNKRMRAFDRYEIGSALTARLSQFSNGRKEEGGFKQVSFIPGEVKYTLPLHLSITSPSAKDTVIVLDNPHREVEKRIMSYLKYLFRTSGILYHVLPIPADGDAGKYPTFQLVLPIPSPPITPPAEIPPLANPPKTEEGWLSSLFRRNNRSASVPPKPREPLPMPAQDAGKVGDTWVSVWAQVELRYPRRRPGEERRTVSTGGTSRSRKPGRNTSANATAPTSPILDDALTLPPLALDLGAPRRPGLKHTETSPELFTSATLSGASAALRTHRRPSPSRSSSAKPTRGPPHHLMSPLSRQVSPDADADDEKDGPVVRKKSSGSSPKSKPASRAASRAGSRVASRAGSRKSTDSGGGTGLQISTNEAPSPAPPLVTSPDDAPSPTERKVSSKSDVIPRRPSSRRPVPGAQVLIHLSDARAAPVIRKALDVVRAPSTDTLRMPAFTPRVPNLQLPEESEVSPGPGIPIRPLAVAAAIEEEPERGRPRSKEDRSGQSAGSSGSPANRLKGRATPVGVSKRSMTTDGVRGT